MIRPQDAELRSLFLASLAIAGAACAAAETPPRKPDVAPTAAPTDTVTLPPVATVDVERTPRPKPTNTPDAPPPEPTNARDYARTFVSVTALSQALPAAELLGFVDIDGRGTTCNGKPCPKEWQALVQKAGAHGAVIRKAGVLEIMMESDFDRIVGKVDTPEKAALRARLHDYHQPATCVDVKNEGFECAPGHAGPGIAVRAAGTDFEVMTFGMRDVCGGSEYGAAKALGVMIVDPTGKMVMAHNLFTEAVDARHLPGVTCHNVTRGRMFEGFVDRGDESTELAYYLRAARQEAAAVHAFLRLAAELRAHGAPEDLVRAAERSAEDERRHARAFRAEAERIFAALGLAPEPTDPGAPETFSIRSLEDVLLENALEGCANETYAAIIVTHQAARAPSPRLRRLLGAIAIDEQAHADLAHRIHAWGATVVDEHTAARIDAARQLASEDLCSGAPITPVGLALGEPPAELARVAFRHASAALVARAA